MVDVGYKPRAAACESKLAAIGKGLIAPSPEFDLLRGSDDLESCVCKEFPYPSAAARRTRQDKSPAPFRAEHRPARRPLRADPRRLLARLFTHRFDEWPQP